MEYRVLETRSADILTKYYNNEIDSFLNACHEDILWIGPAEKHVIPVSYTHLTLPTN